MCLKVFRLVTEPNGNSNFEMWKKVTLPLQGIFLKLTFWCIFAFLSTFSTVNCAPATAVLLNAEPVEAVDIRRVFYKPYEHINKRKSPKNFFPPLHEDYYYEPSFLDSDSFSIGPEDAVSNHKYSPAVIHSSDLHRNRGSYHSQVIRRTPSTHKEVYIPASHTSLSSDSDLSSSVNQDFKSSNPSNPFNNYKYPSVVTEATVTSDYKISGDVLFPSNSYSHDKDHKISDITLKTHLLQNNFTDTNSSHASVSSNTVLIFQPPPSAAPKDNHFKEQHNDSVLYRVPNSTQTENVLILNNTSVPIHDSDEMQNDAPEIPEGNETSVDVFEEQTTIDSTIYYSVDNKVTFSPTESDVKENVSVVSPPAESTKPYRFSSGAVAGIVIAVLTCITIVTSSVIYLLYRKYNGQCTSVVEGKFNSDNCGYLDDSLRSSVYLNNHIELPKENSEEMTSLDNDSFLNSLETMTIQNYWADNTKNTKV